jgi:retron-type reverse transcriptase
MIERNPRKYLYPLWNRLASGSYFPPPVKEVLIPKGKVKKRMLGVPKLLSYYMSSQFVLGMFSDIPIKYL